MAQVAINGEMLRSKLLEVGVKPSRASREIGMSVNYLGYAIKTGTCSIAVSRALQANYGIAPNDYVIEEDDMPDTMTDPAPAKPQKQAEEAAKPGAWRQPRTTDKASALDSFAALLREAVREGVLDAAVQIAANEDLCGALNRIIYNAVKGAIINADRMIKGDL